MNKVKLNLYLWPEQIPTLDALAEEARVSRSEMVRRLLDEMLKQKGQMSLSELVRHKIVQGNIEHAATLEQHKLKINEVVEYIQGETGAPRKMIREVLEKCNDRFNNNSNLPISERAKYVLTAVKNAMKENKITEVLSPAGGTDK